MKKSEIKNNKRDRKKGDGNESDGDNSPGEAKPHAEEGESARHMVKAESN